MLANESIVIPSMEYEDIFSDYIFEFVQTLNYRECFDIINGDRLEFSIVGRDRPHKINPIIKTACPEDVKDIIAIYQDIYDNSYPYKEMEDPDEVLAMVESNNVEFFVFQDANGENIGCFTLVLDFEDKMGYTRGLNIRKKYLGKVDVLKAFMGCFLSACKKYDGKIFRWYGESRTAHTNSQYVMRMCGFRPVGFYPNKDIFYHKIESDILIISYDEKAIREYRTKKLPTILPEVKNSFEYSDRMFRLGTYEVCTPQIILDLAKVNSLKRKIQKEIIPDKYGDQEIKFSLAGSDAYFTFLYTLKTKI